MEEAFNPVEGVDRITSISLEGVSQVVVEFVLERDGDQAAAVLLGTGTAMVYPTLLAAIGDVAHPSWRARSTAVWASC
mgnify:CR=1 FL=1